jgi:hypothetical protein
MKPRLLQLPADAFSPLALTAGNAGLGAWVRAAAWCVGHGIDGAIPMDVALKIAKVEAWQKLERKRLAVVAKDTIHLLQFHATNPTQKQLAEAREVKARAGAKGGKVAAARRASPAPFPPPLASTVPSKEEPSTVPVVAKVDGPKQEMFFALEPVAPPPAKSGRSKKAKTPPVDVEEPESEHAQIKAAFFEAFVAAKGETPAWNGYSGKALKTLISSIEAGPDRVDRIKRLISRAFDDKWFVEKTASMVELARNATRYQGIGKVKPASGMQREDDGIWS